MGIEQIANQHKENEQDPEQIWANKELDALRRKECLCVNCRRKDDNPPYSSCPVAKKLYEISREHSMAMAITRCGATDKEGNLLYMPLK